MNITFNQIKIEGFLSIDKMELKLNNCAFTVIQGKNNNIADNALGNGAGKSSIFDAILFCLTGETSRGIKGKEVVNINTNTGTKIELNFNIDNNNYTIIRTRDHKELGTNIKIIKDGIDISGKGIRDNEVLLQQCLKDLTSDLIGSVIILGQGLPQKFTNNSPSARKELLEKLSKSDYMIEEIKTKLTTRKDFLNNELRKIQDKRLELNVLINAKEVEINKYNDYFNNLQIKPWDNLLNELELQKEEITNNLNLITSQTNSTQLQLDTFIANYNEVTDKYNKLNEKLLTEKFNSLNELNILITQYKTQISFVKKTIEQNKNDDICPTCHQKLLNKEKIDISNLEDELKTLTAFLAQKQIELERVDKKYSDLVEINDDNRINELKDLVNIINNLKSAIADNNNVINQKKDDLKNVELKKYSLEKEKMNYETNYNNFKRDLDKATSELENLKKEEVYNISEEDVINQHLDIVTKMITLTNRDFRGYLLSNVIDFIDIKCKEYSNVVFGHSNLHFRLNGNNIEIIFNDRLFESLSGGEKQKVNLIIQFALRDMLISTLDFRSNIICLDEIFDNLDSLGSQKVIEVITQLSDLSSIFIITHHIQELDIPYDNLLTIIKTNEGVSYLE